MQLQFISERIHTPVLLDSDQLERLPQVGWNVRINENGSQISGVVKRIEQQIEIDEYSLVESLIFHLE